MNEWTYWPLVFDRDEGGQEDRLVADCDEESEEGPLQDQEIPVTSV